MKTILVLLLVGFAVAKPAFDLEEEFVQKLLREEEDPTERLSQRPSQRPSERPGPSKRPKPDEKDIPLFHKFAYFLLKISVGDVKPDEHPDLKYRQPGEEMIKKLLDVRKAIVEALKPIHKIAKLMIEDHIEMMKRVHEAVKDDNIYQAKHIVGEYFIALNRRFVSFFVHAEQSGLFEKIEGDKDMQEVKRAVYKSADAGGEKGKEIAEFILKNFNEFRVSDGLPDRPFVKLGVETAIVLARTFKQMEKVSKISMKVYIDMISDIVRLALIEKNHEGAIQRAGAGVLSMIRRQTKVGIVLHHMYSQKKCFGPGPKEKGEKDEKEDKDEKEYKEYKEEMEKMEEMEEYED